MLDMAEQGLIRDGRGRFVPGQSGNPLGKAPGTRNRATLLRAALEGEEGPTMARIVIDKALAGDVVTARFVLGRLEPKPRSRGIELDLPEGSRARDIVAAFNATVRAMASGDITPDEAVQVARVLDGRLRAIEVAACEAERDERQARQAETKVYPSGRFTPKPAPSGPFDKRSGGLGGGGASRSNVADRVAAKRSHPDPLPRGEGVRTMGDADWSDSPLPPRLRTRSRFSRDLLHSTCISRVPLFSPALVADGWVV